MARTAYAASRTPRRLLPRAERRAAILQAAARVFARSGYAATSMEDIAADAGVTKLILYRHFDSKEALYRAVLQVVSDRLAEQFRAAPEPRGYGIGARTLLEIARAHPAGFRLLWRHAWREPPFAAYADRLRRKAVSSARSALADRVPPEHLEWSAHAVVGYLVEAVLNWIELGNPAGDDRFVAATNEALRAGVRAWSR